MPQYSGVFTLPQQAQALTSGQWVTDPYFKNTTLLLHADGIPGGAQNNTFLDSSSNAFTITRNGNTTQGTFSPYMPNGYWSNYFDGSGDYLDTPTSQAALQFGTGDFTIEMWVYPTAATFSGATFCTSERVGTIANALLLLCDNTSNGKLQLYMDGTNVFASSTNCTLVANAWQHIAISRSGTSVYGFINGVSINNIASNSSNISKGDWRLGYWYQSQHSYNGYISNFRIVKGAALYTSNFTPSTTPLTAITNTSLLTCQSNRFLDNSTNAFTVTPAGNVAVQQFQPFMRPYQYSTSVIGGSGYFDGTGDYLSIANNAALTFNTGDFTVEAWIYPTVYDGSTWPTIVATGNYTNTSINMYTLRVRGDTKVLNFSWGNINNWTISLSSSATIPLNAWTHVAVSRSGSTIRLFVNGIQDGSATSSIDLNSTYATTVGANDQGTFGITAYFTGFISNSRIVKGTALYTSSFTPPTAPLTAITNTSLLCNMTNAGIYDNAMQNNLETVGNAQVSTSVVKYGSGSMYFDGTGDYLKGVANNPNLNFGSGNFTIEFWANVVDITPSVAAWFVAVFNTSSGQNSWGVRLETSGTLNIYLSSDGGEDITVIGSATPGLSDSTWSHIAAVRNGNSVSLYVNGVSKATGTFSAALFNSNQPVTIGVQGNTSFNQYLNGYIDDLRITKGVARYTSNFQPPQVAFANQ